ncbi:ABC transporter permease subunit [Kribbella qitaiheensis]|uniref:ABC transporter permease subunit n=1 Tax=Kribbella qitaiheensis TaxID=1544730 RepID=A0A7G6WW84_9ACTN|nr:ABC transporter permease subunit [Kribbella qitaiheensis]QNE18249.1 ABC transporter permease subunit [Kribbella qitaiheensis]
MTILADAAADAGPPTSPPAQRRGRLPGCVRIGLLLTPALTVVGVFFAGGVAQAIAQSFGYQPSLPGARISTDAYTALWSDPAVRASLLLTGRVAVVSTVLSAVLGVAAALTLRRLGRSRAWVTGVFQANLAVPHLVGALCMLLLLSQGGLLSRLTHAVGLTASPTAFPAVTNDRFGWSIIAEYVWKETPFLTVIVLATLSRGLQDLETAARSLGASRSQRLRHVTLPILTPALAAGSVLVFAFAAGSYEVPYLLGRPYPATLPVVALQYYNATDLTSRPEAMAVAVLITVTSSAIVAAYLTILARLSRRAL